MKRVVFKVVEGSEVLVHELRGDGVHQSVGRLSFDFSINWLKYSYN